LKNACPEAAALFGQRLRCRNFQKHENTCCARKNECNTTARAKVGGADETRSKSRHFFTADIPEKVRFWERTRNNHCEVFHWARKLSLLTVNQAPE
jgi:hypothetical protein